MTLDTRRLCSKLAKIVGADHVLDNQPASLVYAKDVLPYDLEPHNIPYAVVGPDDSREESRGLRYANQHRAPVHIDGSGTSHFLSKSSHFPTRSD